MKANRFVPAGRRRDRIKIMLPGRQGLPGSTAADSRPFLEAAPWRVRTGSPRRDLPSVFGDWNSVFACVRRRARKGAFEGVFKEMFGSFDLERARVDGVAIRARECFRWKGGTAAQAIGRPQGGPATRIMALVDALCNLVRFELVPGQAHDLAGLPPMLNDLDFGALIVDKALDIDWLAEKLEARGGTAVIPSKSGGKVKRRHDRKMYSWRRRIKNFFAKIKEFRVIATRCGKTVAGFRAIINLEAGVIAAR